MAERMDICFAKTYTDRDGKEKTQWTKIGVLFANRNGQGYSGTLEMLPVGVPVEAGKPGIRIAAFPPKPRDGGGGGGKTSGGGYSDADYAEPDDLPF